MAWHRPATLVHTGRHVTWYGDDAQRSRAIALVNALLGNWGREGGFYFPASFAVAKYPYPPYPHGERGAVDNPDTKYPVADLGLTNGIRAATISGAPYPINGWFVYATNLLQALPNQEETIRAIQALDLMVVVDVVPSEIAGWADLVLPETVYLERYDDFNTEAFREIERIGERQAPVEIAKERHRASVVEFDQPRLRIVRIGREDCVGEREAARISLARAGIAPRSRWIRQIRSSGAGA